MNVNVNTILPGDSPEDQRARAERRALLKLLTFEERKIYLDLLRVAAERQQEQKAAAKAAKQPAIEVTVQPVAAMQEGANSPAIMPIPGAGLR